MNSDILVKVEGVRKKFCRSLKRSLWYGMKDTAAELRGGSADHDHLRDGEFWAINDVSFELRRGECLGLIGRNGAGKTTLLKMLNGLIKPDAGRITMRGRVGALIALGAGFNPILTGRENTYVNAAVLGLSKRETDARIDEIIDFAGLRDFIDSPVQSYSSGMQVRLGFAVATALNPDILLLDEVLAVGDTAFRNRCYRRIISLRKKAAVIFVSHSMEQISRICDSALVMATGGALFQGDVATGVARYEALNENGQESDEAFLSVQPPISCFDEAPQDITVASGAPLRLIFRTTSEARLDDFILRILLYNAAGAIVADCNLAAKHYGLALPLGESCWEVTLDSIPLKNGPYRLAINLIDENGDIIVWSYKRHEIRVTGGYGGAIADCQLQLQQWKLRAPSCLAIS